MEFPKNNPLKKLEELARKAKERGFGVKEKEYDPQLLEFLKKKYNPFLNFAYRENRGIDQDFKPTFKLPQDINWKELVHAKGESSEYYINPEMSHIEFQKLKPVILNEPKWKEMTVPEIMSEVAKDYQDTHYIPGVEYLEWLLDNPSSVPEEMKTGELLYFPGSVFTRKDGSWNFMLAIWRETLVGNLYSGEFELRSAWTNVGHRLSKDGIVLLEKNK